MLWLVPVPPLYVMRLRWPELSNCSTHTGADAVASSQMVIGESGCPYSDVSTQSKSGLSEFVYAYPEPLPARPALNHPFRVIPPDRPGNAASLQIRYQPLVPPVPSSPACCHEADPGLASTGLPAALIDDVADAGSPYIHPALVPTAYVAMFPAGGDTAAAKNPLLMTVWVMSTPLNPYVSWTTAPPGSAWICRTFVLPVAAFSSVVGRTPFSPGWSSIGHHAYGLSS